MQIIVYYFALQFLCQKICIKLLKISHDYVGDKFFYKTSLRKRKRQCVSFHVSFMLEEIKNGSQKLLWTILRETPGAHSKHKNKNCCNLEITVKSQLFIFVFFAFLMVDSETCANFIPFRHYTAPQGYRDSILGFVIQAFMKWNTLFVNVGWHVQPVI